MVSPCRPEVVAQLAVARLVCRPDDRTPIQQAYKQFSQRIHNVVDGDVLQATWEELVGKVKTPRSTH